MDGERPRGWRFIDLAALGDNSWRRYAATLLRIVLLPAAFFAAAIAALYGATAQHLLGRSELRTTIVELAFAIVIVAGVGLVWGVTRSHRRPWLSLISTDLTLDWRRLAIGAGVEGGLLLLLVLLGHLAGGQPWPNAPRMALPALAAILLMVPFQAASEEMLFRGYLTQALGRVLRSRALIAVLVGVVFGALHGNAYGWVTIPYICLLSLIYSLVSLRDERLELTIGAHTATNWFGIGAIDALDKTGATGVQLTLGAIAVLIANYAVFFGVTRLLVGRFCDRR